MLYINCGAVRTSDQSDILTKKLLRELLTTNPAEVTFYTTDVVRAAQQRVNGQDLDAWGIYQVCGPNPYTARKWHASVTRAENGKVTVK